MCNKIGYDSQKEATEEGQFLHKNLRKQKGKMKKHGSKLRAYKCDDCDKWHLTTGKTSKAHKARQREIRKRQLQKIPKKELYY